MNRPLGIALSTLVLAGCAASPPRPRMASSVPAEGTPASRVGAEGPALGTNPPPSAMRQRFEQLRAQLAPQGAQFRGYAAAGFITQRVNVTTVFDLAAGECLSIIALASSGIRDLDARVERALRAVEHPRRAALGRVRGHGRAAVVHQGEVQKVRAALAAAHAEDVTAAGAQVHGKGLRDARDHAAPHGRAHQ